MRIDAVTVTRDLPPTVSALGASRTAAPKANPTLATPALEVPGVDLDYPTPNLATQEEFDAAVNKNAAQNSKPSDQDTSKARELANQLPPAGALQQGGTPLNQTGLERDRASLSAKEPQPTLQSKLIPAPAPKTEQPAASMTLPLLGTFPLPSKENIALASTTAVTATFVAVLGKAVLEASLEGLKPALRLLMIRYKKLRNRDLSDQEIQLEFAYNMNAKGKGKRGIKEIAGDFWDYMRDNFFEDVIG